MRFYTACFGFRQPFKILCDGTFIHHLIVNNIKPADQALSNILAGAPVKLFTTRCVLAELKRLGSSYYQALEAAHQLITARCDHEASTSADACVMEVIGESNPEHFFVATQDTDLRKKFHEVPGVPVIFALRNALFLEPPSSFQRQFVKNSEEERLHMTKLDYKMLQKRVGNKLIDKEADDSLGENEDSVGQNMGMPDLAKPQTAKKGMSVKDKVQFKRKKAKGPNPLSCKKKKDRGKPNVVSEKEKKHGENSIKSRSRKRKRTHGGKKLAENSG